MQQSSSFELSWSNLIDLWNESSYEKGADLSFKEIVILESFAEEGVEPCQGFDWLPVAKLAEPVKPKKRTISAVLFDGCNYRPLLFSNPLFRGLFHF